MLLVTRSLFIILITCCCRRSSIRLCSKARSLRRVEVAFTRLNNLLGLKIEAVVDDQRHVGYEVVNNKLKGKSCCLCHPIVVEHLTGVVTPKVDPAMRNDLVYEKDSQHEGEHKDALAAKKLFALIA